VTSRHLSSSQRARDRPGNMSAVEADPTAEGGRGSYALFRVSAQLQESTWGFRFSRKYPDLRLELLNRMELGHGELLVELRMLGADAGRLAREWSDYPGVTALESYPESERSVLYRVTSTVPSIERITREHGVLTRYPIVVQDGWARFETFGRPAQIRAYLEDLRRRIGPNRVESVRQGSASLRSLGLSPAQDAVFREALSSGYYGSPRGISVTTLARNLGRSKSTVSVTLAKIQRRLADSALQLDLASSSLLP
jgi:predicted DNA binding protein